MIKALLGNLTVKDKRALAVFFGIALVSAIYFASGILVTYVSSPAGVMEMATSGDGYTLHIYGFQSYADAQSLVNQVRNQRHLQTDVEPLSSAAGAGATGRFLVKIGPLARQDQAEALKTELLNADYRSVEITKECLSGADCPPSSLNNRKK